MEENKKYTINNTEELEGKREEMKGPILESIRALFTKQEDKIQIINISITDYKVAQ